MILYFLRHANAGERLATPKKDEKRALDKDGIEQCGYVGRALAAMDVQVDLIVSSPLKRSTQTAVLVANKLNLVVALFPGSRRRVGYRSRTPPWREFFRLPKACRQACQAGSNDGGRPQSELERISRKSNQRQRIRIVCRLKEGRGGKGRDVSQLRIHAVVLNSPVAANPL